MPTYVIALGGYPNSKVRVVKNLVTKVCKSYHPYVSIVFHSFSQFSLDVKVSQTHGVFLQIGFVALPKHSEKIIILTWHEFLYLIFFVIFAI